MADKLDIILERLEMLERRISAIEHRVPASTRPSTQLVITKRKEEPEYPYNPDFGR